MTFSVEVSVPDICSCFDSGATDLKLHARSREFKPARRTGLPRPAWLVTLPRQRVSITASSESSPCAIEEGTLAPDFKLPSTAGTDVVLSSFRGKQNVLLAFFPLAFTSTCTAELCAFSEDFDRFASAGTAVLPISVDSVPTLREFKEKFFTQRAYFLIDRAGQIRWQHTEAELGQRRDDTELLRQIATLEA